MANQWTETDTVTGLTVYTGSNIIAEPGRFECCARYVPEFWGAVMDGEGTDHADRLNSVSVEVTPEDKAKYPELRRRKRVRMYQSEQGFVNEV